MTFDNSIHNKLAVFAPYLKEEITIYSRCFNGATQTVQAFVDEIEHTAQILGKVANSELAEFYSDKLILQFRTLQKAIDHLVQESKKPKIIEKNRKKFESSYRFPKNVHSLRPARRLEEYKKALRILNEKIQWIIDQSIESQNSEDKIYWQMQLQETEYRKEKCIEAIEQAEEDIWKKR